MHRFHCIAIMPVNHLASFPFFVVGFGGGVDKAYGWDMLCSFGTAGDPVIMEVEEAKKDAMVTGRTNIVQHFSAEFVVSTLVGEGLHIPSQPQQQPQQSKQQSRQQSQQPQQQRRQSEQQEPMRSQGRAQSAHVRTVERQPRTREITRETTKSHPSRFAKQYMHVVNMTMCFKWFEFVQPHFLFLRCPFISPSSGVCQWLVPFLGI